MALVLLFVVIAIIAVYGGVAFSPLLWILVLAAILAAGLAYNRRI